MKSFAALVWNEQDASVGEVARRLIERLERSDSDARLCLDVAGLRLYSLDSDDAADHLPIVDHDGNSAGGVFGKLFRNSEGGGRLLIETFNDDQTASILTSSGRSLISDFWGSYVGFIKRPRHTAVVTDPTSSLPCYYLELDGVFVFFSHLERCGFIDRSTLSINLDFVAALLIYDKFQNGETGLNEVRELMGGHRLTIGPETTRTELLWDPRDVAHCVAPYKGAEAEAVLRETTTRVVDAWSEGVPKVWVSLSGGLDSSIVLGCLSASRNAESIGAVHRVFTSDDPSELKYAREAADLAGLDLVTVQSTPRRTIPEPGSHPLSARPMRQFVANDIVAAFESLCEEEPSRVFTGQGGDHLFFASNSVLFFVDFLKHNGLLSGIMSPYLLDAARLSGTSVWQVLNKGISEYFLPRHKSAFVSAMRKRRTLVNQTCHDRVSIEDCLPSWTVDSAGNAPGKFLQVCGLMHLFQIRQVFYQSGLPDLVHPLASQPLIELCLRLPTYVLAQNGQSRGLARDAFRGLIPESIRTRKTKGGATTYYADFIQQNIVAVAEELRSGLLAKSGLVDAANFQRFIDRSDYRTHKFGHMLLVYYTIESWMRSWTQATQTRSSVQVPISAPA